MNEHDPGERPPIAGGRPADRRVAALYDEIHRLAAETLRREGGKDVLLQPTMLVNEVYLKLARSPSGAWDDEAHFLAVAAKAARHVVLDHARALRRAKRGGGATILSLDTTLLGGAHATGNAIDLEEALQQLERGDPRSAAIVELRFFGGLTIEQTAMRLGLSTATVEREWRFARAWLYDALFRDEADAEGPGGP
ncbi:MAG: sigma-70 family RNA polymerase sigma factor [Phycisphaerales bacterium]|nr:sigma-70 family RNA polymerase sigma factor [Phycisphaerae bacterium]NNF44368.1 sigma-70 family RNA polymerase sigma factor [Phycisphaerales bacterium]NNM25495.1 sigma-70 family RNA polymerase sigma factor [Phycisphaerales bacterium]